MVPSRFYAVKLQRALDLLCCLAAHEEGGNATELDVVLRSHFVKHWKNGKFDVVTTEMTTEIIKLEI